MPTTNGVLSHRPAAGAVAGVDDLKSHLEAPVTTTFQLVVEPRLWEPDNPTVRELLGPARRVAVVHDGLPDPVARYLGRHPTPEYALLDGRDLAGWDETEAVHAILRFAVTAGLRRRDAFLSIGPARVAGPTAVAATMFRRYAPAVRVHTDLLSVLQALRDGSRITVAGGGFLAHQRHTVVVVDADAVGADRTPLTSPEWTALRHLARWDEVLAELVARPAPGPGALRRAGLDAARRLFARAGAGAPLWTPSADGSGTDGRSVPGVHRLSYQVSFGADVFGRSGPALLAHLPPGARVAAVVDDFSTEVTATVRHWLRERQRAGRLGEVTVHPVRSSPRHKTFPAATALAGELAPLRLGPQDRIVAMGGGTVLDLAGHVAAYHAVSTPYLRIPTTLVGLVDAGIGLKVGVDVDGRKNLVGAYHPPVACLCDPGFLASLPAPEYRCGLAEIIKIALVCDADLFTLVERHHAHLLATRTGPAQTEMLRRAVAAMLHELERNPLEEHLWRLPDFGHEFGHVLEERSGFRLRHGEAVAIGMAISCELAVATGRLAPQVAARLLALLRGVGLPVYDESCTAADLWHAVRTDVMAHKGGHLHLVVPTGIGEGGFIDSIDELDPEMLADVWRRLRRAERG